MRVRRSNEERIQELESKIKKLKEKKAIEKAIEKEVKLTKESAGIAEAIAAIEKVASVNNFSVAEVIKAISRFKRTGLKIENPKSK